MMTWLLANLVNIVLVAVIALAVGLVIRGMIRSRRAGKRSCGCSCADCGICGACGGCVSGGTKGVHGASR